MDAPTGAIGSVLAGRSAELGTVHALFDRVASGEAGALLVYADAGVGKTSLVHHACARVADSALILAGASLPLTSMTVPFLPIRAALRGARDGDPVMPRLFELGDSISNVPIMFDAWLDDMCSERPVILFVDDLQWADQSTLDLLMCVLAGPADRRLAVVGTVRTADAHDSNRLEDWLADVRRLPRVVQLTLKPLDRAATGDQVADLLGAPPHQSLVDDVFSHTRGNPYLNRLVVTGMSPTMRNLPAHLPSDLKSFVLRSWRTRSSRARQLAAVLALGGRPLAVSDLREVSLEVLSAGDLDEALREALESGALEMAPDGTVWFHHPMDATVLLQSLPELDRRRWHATFAELEERRLADKQDVETMVAVADHHHQAGQVPEAYRWAIRAAEATEAAGGSAEMLRLLRRAIDLRRQLPKADESAKGLLYRLMRAAAATAAYEDELQAVDALLAELERETEPLLAAELLTRRARLRMFTGRAFVSPDDLHEAVRLAAASPNSWQHAAALAALCRVYVWQDDSRATEIAEAALDAAQRADDPRALSYALTSAAMVAVAADRQGDGFKLAGDALDAAVEAGDFRAFCYAATWEANACECVWSSRPHAELIRKRREQLMEIGAPHPLVAELSALEASSWLAIGEPQKCLERLRDALGSDPGPFADVSARLTAARLAALQGRAGEAQAHLDRAEELFAEGSGYLGLPFHTLRTEVLLAVGDSPAAFEAALAGASLAGLPPHMCEWLMPLAARALADQIQARRDAEDDPSDLLTRLDDLTARFPGVIRDFGESTGGWHSQLAALDDLYQAEVGRARQHPDNGAQWVRAADGFGDAKLAWEECYACWRGAESLLVRGGTSARPQAAAILRRGLQLADDLGARPLKTNLETLASSARIGIGRIHTVAASTDQSPTFKALTPREREILELVVAGRTYGEIARALVISEKTVSSHISNLLRKTGTSNRVELSRLAARTAGLD